MVPLSGAHGRTSMPISDRSDPVNSTATDMWGFQATVGTAARLRWSGTDTTAFVSRHHALASKPLPSAYVAINAKGIHHRPPEDSN